MRPLHHDRLVKLVLQIVQAAAIRGHSRGNTKVFNKCLKADANNTKIPKTFTRYVL